MLLFVLPLLLVSLWAASRIVEDMLGNGDPSVAAAEGPGFDHQATIDALSTAVAIGAGLLAGSSALLGFGFDSLIESLSGGVMLWRLREGEKGEARERLAQKLVGASLFFALARGTARLAQA